MGEVFPGGGFVLDTPDEIQAASWLALRSALSLQLKGLRLSRNTSASAIAIRRLQGEGLVAPGKKPQAATLLKILNKMIADRYGM